MSPRRKLPDDAFVVHGLLYGVSVNCAPGKSVEELSQGIPNGQIGVTTVERIRAAGGDITPDAIPPNPDHCLLNGVDAQTAAGLFTPTILNPNRPRRR